MVMARGRFISKKISESARVNDLPDDTARLLYTWMIPHLDRDGRMVGDAILVRNKVMPYSNISVKQVEHYLQLMNDAIDPETGYGLITRYKVGEHCYIWMQGFDEEQVGLVYNREPKSDIPAPPEEPLKDPPASATKGKVKTSPQEEGLIPMEDYIKQMKALFPMSDVDVQWEKCQLRYKEQRKKLKNPRLALRNWLEKEVDMQKNNKHPLTDPLRQFSMEGVKSEE
jgi:hypothetical protein